MSRLMTADEIAKLPKWAQGAFTDLTNQVRTLEEINAGLTQQRDAALNPAGSRLKTRVSIRRYDHAARQQEIPIDEWSRIVFKLGKGKELECSIKEVAGEGPVLEVMAPGGSVGGSLAVFPQVSNVVRLRFA